MTSVDPKLVIDNFNKRNEAFLKLRAGKQHGLPVVKETAISFEESTRQKILAKLKNETKPENILAVAKHEMGQAVLEALGEGLSEAEKDMWFPSQEVKTDLMKVTSNLMDTDHWDSLLERYKNGEIRTEEMRDFVILSHVAVTTEPDPIAVLDRQVRDSMKSRSGAKIVDRLLLGANQAMSGGFQALVEALPLEHRPDIKLLSAGDNTQSDSDEPGSLTVFTRNELSLDVVTPEYKEQMIREFFAGDIIYDRLIEVSFDELKSKLLDENDYEFDSKRALIVDAGMEQTDKATRRKEYKEGLEGKKFVLYSSWLSNIFDGFGGTHSDDRGIDKYRMKEDITHEQFLVLMGLVKKRYVDYIDGRIEFSELVTRWKSRPEILAERKAKETK